MAVLWMAMYYPFIVNENREQEDNRNEIGDAKAIRPLAAPETETDEAFSRRGDREIHQRPIKGTAVGIVQRMLLDQRGRVYLKLQ
ncbi:Hypothetical predicted protein, partial [Marmota monax]